MSSPAPLYCRDIIAFQEKIKEMRSEDDRIVYQLNNAIPTASFKGDKNPQLQCATLHKKMEESHASRGAAIAECVTAAAAELEGVRASGDSARLREARLLMHTMTMGP